MARPHCTWQCSRLLRQPDHRDHEGDCDVNLKSKLGQRQHAVDLSFFPIRATPDFINNERRFTVANSPHRLFDARMTLRQIEAVWKNQFVMIGLVDFILIRDSPASLRRLLIAAGTVRLSLAGFLRFCVLPPLLIGLHRMRLVQPPRRILHLQLRDTPLQLLILSPQNRLLQLQLCDPCGQFRVTRLSFGSVHGTISTKATILAKPRFPRGNRQLPSICRLALWAVPVAFSFFPLI